MEFKFILRRMINMSMEVTSNYGGYTTGTYDTTVKKNTAAKSDNSTNSVDEYYEKLCKKFPQISFNTNGGIMSSNGNNIVLNLSSDCLKKMSSDPTFAKKIENDISGIPAAQEWMNAKAKSDGIEIQGFAVRINADGSMQCSCSGSTRTSNTNKNSSILNTNDSTKDRLDNLREKRRKKAKELENAQKEKIAEKRAEKKAKEEAGAETLNYTISATGTDIKTITQSVVSASLGTSTSTGASFDIKA
jgi:hypothetical protein